MNSHYKEPWIVEGGVCCILCLLALKEGMGLPVCKTCFNTRREPIPEEDLR